ncbi:MAG: hypothetical protein GEU71_15745 [Actinobacteria bacterium]|nr:hypothetical protein [Actinomycetota bacterium]
MTIPIVTLKQARRIAVDAQGLAAERREADVMGVARRLRCIQFDPINAVARTQQLVLFSRLGTFDTAELDRVLFEDRSLFSYWAHAASLVLTEDYAIHAHRMKSWPGDNGKWRTEVAAWMDEHKQAQRYILRELKTGPKRAKDLAHDSMKGWESSGWNANQTITRLLDFMWIQGRIMIAGRQGVERLWARSDLWFPPEVRARRMSHGAAVEQATIHSLRALGIGTKQHISRHFIEGQYPDLPKVLESLVKKGVVTEVAVKELPGRWYMLTKELDLIEATAKGWRGRTTLLSPFDNLIRDRARTESMFDFEFRLEIYVPKAKRKYGYYVLAILDGDRLAGRIDPKMDRTTNTLVVNAVHSEEWAEGNLAIARRARRSIEALAAWRGATSITYGRLPSSWAPAFDD